MNLVCIKFVFLCIVQISICYGEEPPILMPLPTKSVLLESAAFRLYCFTSAGTKPVFFQWQKNGQILSNSRQNNYKIETSEDISQSVLIIQNITRTDAGNYSCVCKNSFGSDTQNSLLLVKVAIKWVLEPKDTRINSGEDVFIECKADGEPKPKITWKTAKGVIIEGESVLINKYIDGTQSKITCIADNGDKEVLRKQITVYVSDKMRRTVIR